MGLTMRARWIAVGVAGVVVGAVLPMSTASGTSTLPPLRFVRAAAVEGPGVTVAWRWPASDRVRRAKIRYLLGSRPPRGSSSGDAAGIVSRGGHSLTVYGLLPDSTYTFAVFAQGHGLTGVRQTVSVRTEDAPTVTSAGLPSGVVGLPYSTDLTVANSSSGQWALEAGLLPEGLSLSGSRIAGVPTAAGRSSFVLRYLDSHGATAYAGTSITIDPATPEPAPTPTPTPTATPSPAPSATP